MCHPPAHGGFAHCAARRDALSAQREEVPLLQSRSTSPQQQESPRRIRDSLPEIATDGDSCVGLTPGNETGKNAGTLLSRNRSLYLSFE